MFKFHFTSCKQGNNWHQKLLNIWLFMSCLYLVFPRVALIRVEGKSSRRKVAVVTSGFNARHFTRHLSPSSPLSLPLSHSVDPSCSPCQQLLKVLPAYSFSSQFFPLMSVSMSVSFSCSASQQLLVPSFLTSLTLVQSVSQ